MKSLTAEWVAKAESDYWVMSREAQVTERPAPDAVCFHAQQYIEKYAKAFLQEQAIEFERTHDLVYLHTKCAAVDSAFNGYKTDFEKLDDYSVDIRYPGDSAAEGEAREAVLITHRVRAFIRAQLGLPEI